VRTVNVDSRYILWVMDAVDGAHNLLQEMGLPAHPGSMQP
jgi:peptidase S46-like protein